MAFLQKALPFRVMAEGSPQAPPPFQSLFQLFSSADANLQILGVGGVALFGSLGGGPEAPA